MLFLQCKSFRKDIKSIKKACSETNLLEKIKQEVRKFLGNQANLSNHRHLIFVFENYLIFKLRIGVCGRGKSSGLRVIFVYEKEREFVVFLRTYRKSECENIPSHVLRKELVDCLTKDEILEA